MVALPEPIYGSQIPRICLTPEHDDALGQLALEWCSANTIDLDPWQQMILSASLGARPDGKFASFEVALCVSRQNGKGEILLARELFGAVELGERLIIHSAHEFATSSEHFRRMEDKIEEAGLQAALKAKAGIKRSHGEEGFEFKNGSRIRFRTRTKGGGRGFTGDLVVLDEAQELSEFFHGTLLPIVSARSVKGNPQVWYTANAVDQMIHDNGIVMARQRERGIAGEHNLAYFEFSLDASNPEELSDEMLGDIASWVDTNPAMGIRISVEHIAKEFHSMGRRQFAVERCCVGDWPATDAANAIIDAELWAGLIDKDSRPRDPVVFAFDVRPSRSDAVIAVVGRRQDGLLHGEIIDKREGTGWLVPRLVELDEKHRPSQIVCDGIGPGSSLVPQLKQAGVPINALETRDVGRACAMLYDAIQQREFRHLGSTELTSAVRGAAQRPLGDAWAWSRKNSATDISPLVAVTLGVFGVISEEDNMRPMIAAV